MLSSGTTAAVTTSAANATLITAGGQLYNHLSIVNEGTVAGFFSVDGGNTWGRIPAAIPPFNGAAANSPGFVEWWGQSISNVLMKRDGGSNMSGVYATADYLGQ